MSFPPICTLFYHISFTKKDSRRRKSPFCLFLIFCHLLPPFAFQHGNQLRSAKQMKHCLGGYHRHLLRNTASFCAIIVLIIQNNARRKEQARRRNLRRAIIQNASASPLNARSEREKSFEMSARRNAQATT